MRTLSGEETGSKFRHADRTFESYLEREIQENILHRGFKKIRVLFQKVRTGISITV